MVLPPPSFTVVAPVLLIVPPGGAASSVLLQITEPDRFTVPPSKPPPLSSKVQFPVTVEFDKV